jgi:hypothetical protein
MGGPVSRVGVSGCETAACVCRCARFVHFDDRSRSRAFTPLRGATSFCLGKGKQNRQRLTLAGPLARSPALLAGNGTARELAALKHPRLFGRFRLRCSARLEGAEDQEPSNGQCRSNSPSRLGATRTDIGSAWGEPACLLFAFAMACALKTSVRHGAGTRTAPQGDVHGCTTFLEGTWTSLPKIPRPVANPRVARARRPGRVSLPSLLCTSKESRWDR